MLLSLKKKDIGSNWVKLEGTQALKVDYPTLAQTEQLEEVLLDDTLDDKKRMLKYQRLFIKFTIKDWKGLPDKCKVVDNELDSALWEDVVSNFSQVSYLFTEINKVLEWNEFDRKK